jgi:ABC-type uncharacterized transport system permease subunit
MSGPGTDIATAELVTVAPSPAFYLALALYGAAALLYVSAFVQVPVWVQRAARWALALAFLAHGVDIGWRGVEHVHPGTSVREALGFLSWIMVGGYLFWSRRIKLALLGAFVAPAALAILAVARLTPSGEAMEDLGALGRIHISLATLGVAMFALATAVAVMYLAQDRSLKRKEFDNVVLKRGAALDTLDRLSHRLVVIGFPIFTASLLLGVIWVSRRQGGLARPEWLIALVIWAAFGGLIVARTTRGWRGKRAAFLTIAGFTASLAVLAIYLARRALGG